MNTKLLLCLALLLGGGLGVCLNSSAQSSSDVATNGWQTKTIASEADLDRVIAQLQTPATRFDAMLALLDFAGYPKGNISNDDLKVNAMHQKAINAMDTCPGLDAVINTMIAELKDPDKRLSMIEVLLKLSSGFGGIPGYTPNTPLEKLMNRANAAAQGAFDVPTVKRALTDSNWLLRIAAVDHFGNPPAGADEWKPLLPQVEKLATDDNSDIRCVADGKLQGFPGTGKFLDERLTNETSPDVILELLRNLKAGKELSEHFLPLFTPLLNHPDEKVREDALMFVGSNSGRAPMLRFAFGMDVFNRVIIATRAKSTQERYAAAYALTDIRRLDPDRSREAFLRLADDPSEGVRWQAAFGLADQYDREDVKRAIAKLVNDPSPVVRFMTIIAVNPRKFVPQLQELTDCRDAQVAEWATDKLKQIGAAK